MNIEGRALLGRFGFIPPIKERELDYSEISKINLDELYEGNRCGVSIEISPANMKLSDGPNPEIKLHGAHNVPQDSFFEAFNLVCERARERGFSPSKLRFAICHSVPHSVSMSGVCVRVDKNGFGYLACDVLNGVRKGDFNADYSVSYRVEGTHPIGNTKSVTTSSTIPDWAVNQMYGILQRVNRFSEGVFGVEFVLDKELKMPIFHDMYWLSNISKSVAQKFHLDN